MEAGMRRGVARSVVAVTLAVLAGLAQAAPGPAATVKAPPAAERKAAAVIAAPALRGHVKFLASDLLEGRLPGSRGGRLAEAYVATQLEALGLEPGAPDGGWLQPVPLVGVTSTPEGPLQLAAGERSLALAPGDDVMVLSGVQREQSGWRGAEVVFVGYGITAPEFGWDDFKDVEVKGKVLLVMNNDPEDDPALFAGKTRLYYGRWSYKYEEAARHGAAGVIIIHTTPSAAYPWQVVRTSWAGQKLSLPEDGGPTVEVRAWATEEASRRIAALGGHDLDQLRAAAQRRDFRPVPLGVSATLRLQNAITHTTGANVLARLPGRDPRRAGEAVIYTAHHDHLGTIPGAAPGADAIYNGAIDNATGVAALLEIARAFMALPQRPARSILFAAQTAEEQGLLGSEWLALHPPVPAGRLAAVINMDAMNVQGRTRDLVIIGRGKSSLDAEVEALAAWQGRRVRPELHPDFGSYYRSDQFSLARVGVPGAYVAAGTDYVGRPAGWGEAQGQAFTRAHYHQPSDEWRDEFDLSGMVEDARLLFHLGARIAEAPGLPTWRPGEEFEAARLRALEAVGAAR
jgi:Zn-dependent M28 family amino/carboxypeptidase